VNSPADTTGAALATPAGACDTHVHVIGPAAEFPMIPGRVYTPPDAAPEQLLQLHESLGMDRVVLVQLSAYGTDNRCLLAGLATLGERARGVAVVDDAVPDEGLAQLNAAGVRGLRINLTTFGLRDARAAEAQLRRTAERAAAFGWHVQIYADSATLTALREVIVGLPTPVAIDHFGSAPDLLQPGDTGYATMLSLAASGRVYVKLSGTYRFSDGPATPGVARFARDLIEVAPERMLWATDWPHTAHGPAGVAHDPHVPVPFQHVDDRLALRELKAWAGTAQRLQQILVENPTRLYGF
jgi:predicted TIM-barrel fold metal-dependent hydrolase